MGSRESDQPKPRLLSSVVVRPSNSEGSGGGGGGGGDVSGGREYLSVSARRDPPPHYSRSGRHSDELALDVASKKLVLVKAHHDAGYKARAGSVSPARQRNSERRYSPDIDRPPHGRDIRNHREAGRFRDPSPPHETGRAGSRPYNRGFGAPGADPSPFRGEAKRGNNPNVRPREGDWYCPEPGCNNLNFARRDNCNTCHRPRSLAGGHPGPRPLYPSPRLSSGPLMGRSPPRPFNGYRSPPRPSNGYRSPPRSSNGYRSPPRSSNGYRSPPREWVRDKPVPRPRGFIPGALPPPRQDYHHHPRRDRLNNNPDEEFRGRQKFDRPAPPDWGHQDRMREGFFNERKGYERPPPPLSPPFQPPPFSAGHDRWGPVPRERSRSPIGGPPKGYQRDPYVSRGRDDRRSGGRGRTDRVY